MAYSTCLNYLEYDGVVYGEFNCPVYGFDTEANMCCGLVNQQYCCTQLEFDEFLRNATIEMSNYAESQKQTEESGKISDTVESSTKKSGGSLNFNDISAMYKAFKNSSISTGDGGLMSNAKDLLNMYNTFKNITRKDKRHFYTELEN